ncbi:ATP-binding protein [Rhodoblastus sp. 17X3]|uniref:ATP-binding protein n=1 Tax=Rhodoblastus sp. 17X3 TaxID=3047026 RepID=UPI0024B69552|nr:ATP-binding protein [Rhodoblastus sp. 17X3]MDI9846804.1 ATP-binding protein [Rhodoblastus sp. 17X3]
MKSIVSATLSTWAGARKRTFALASRRMSVARENPEQGILLNRLCLALVVLSAASLHAHYGGATAHSYLVRGLPWLEGYILLIGLTQAHLAFWPAPNAMRRVLSVCADVVFISVGLSQGDAASAYLATIYFWLILGYGVRFGLAYMGVAVASSAVGFAFAIWMTPFWQANAALSAGLFCSLIVIPAYGAVLLGRLNEARAEAERANRAKTLLLANVSHELRTPLTAILGLGELLKQSGLDAGQRDMVQTLSGAANILLRHIEALLSVSRDDIGSAAPRLERVDLFALLLSLRDLLAVEADKKGVRLGLCLEAGAPQHIRAEPGLLLDILHNLVGNAVKFTSSGAVAIAVRLLPGDGGDIRLRFEVRDTGIGIDKAAQERIFEAFVQAGPDIAPRFGGSGLGLAIARRRLEARGGRIGVESAPGRGALFWFELAAERDAAAPAAESAVAPALRLDGLGGGGRRQRREPVCVVAPDPFDTLRLARLFAVCLVAREGEADQIATAQRMTARLSRLASGAPESADISETRAPRLAGRKILLAEDNGVNRRILAAMLAGGGFETTCVEDGHAALDAMLNGAFDLILLDLNLPRINGLDAARLYRFGVPDSRRAPVLALTTDASPERRDECLEAGMAACLTKPIAPDALLAAIDHALLAAEAGRAKAAPPQAPAQAIDAEPAPILAPEALDALARLGGEEFLHELIAQFIAEAAQILENMALALEQGDFAAFRREAHALESSAGNVGAAALARLCRSRRAAAPEAFALYGDDYLDDLRSEWARATRALNGALARRAARETPSRGRGAAA